MKKYFFFDIDRTLSIGITQVVPEDTKACLRQLQDAGHFVAIASGRLQSDVAAFAQPLGITSFVADGGNSLTLDGKIIYREGLPRQKVAKLLQELNRCQLPWSIVTDNQNRLHTTWKGFTDPERSTYFSIDLGPVDLNAVPVIYKMLVVRPDPKGPQPDWQGLTRLPYFGNTYLIEPVDKGSGIRRCMQYLQASCQDVVVFGDGYNDLLMFLPEWFSIAMGNAREPLKEKANYITANCEEGGIMKACKKFNWI